MDYVVFGIGYGATILVLGLLLRDFGPRLRFRRARDGGDILGAEELVAKVSWTRFCTALGTVLALAGAAFLLITLVAMVFMVSDDTGLWVMSVAFGLLLIIAAYWTWAYFHRFGSYGILPERVEPEPAFTEQSHAASTAIPGPPAPELDDDDDDESAELEPPVADEPTETPDVEPDDLEGERETDEDVQEDEAEPEPRLRTPEERLAESESPINHGSAEGDLDLAASGPRRPGTVAPRQFQEARDVADAADADDEVIDADKDRADA